MMSSDTIFLVAKYGRLVRLTTLTAISDPII
jgi:hypothetical protein